MPTVRTLAAALLLVAGLLVPPASSPGPAAAVGPLPDCRLDDIYTEPRGYDDWAIIQVDWILTLGPQYTPPDLVSVRNSGIAGGGLVREIVIDDLTAMVKAAKANGTPLVAWSPYRSYKQQVKLFNGYAGWSATRGTYSNFESAITYSARPGHSEHQTGLAIDFVAVGDDGLTSDWEVTPTGRWMATQAWEYGWLMSYPKDKKDVTCYRYEPWHYRYVGRDLAKKIHDSGLTIREYLWANYTQIDPACVALPAPPLVTPGEPRSCAFAAASAPPTAPPPTSAPATGAATAPPPPTLAPAPSPAPTAPPGPANAGAELGTLGLAGLAALVLLAGIAALLRSRRRARSR